VPVPDQVGIRLRLRPPQPGAAAGAGAPPAAAAAAVPGNHPSGDPGERRTRLRQDVDHRGLGGLPGGRSRCTSGRVV